MVKISKEETLRVVAAMWRWLEKHPTKGKWQWPGWKQFNGEAYPPYCACGLYVDYRHKKNEDGADCIPHCPMLPFWEKYKSDEEEFEDGPCTILTSPFTTWRSVKKAGKRKLTVYYAGLIKRGAEKLLREHLNGTNGVRKNSRRKKKLSSGR
ncbi:MAG: hypothetical protein KAR06_03565 [Deltaproteobacteria bacterium]|nr:hypothetical protein [Deltaproteobacteria bacterium]